MSDKKHYAERDMVNQKFYFDHVLAMTAENLHSKAAIAAELAHRDEINQSLQFEVSALRDKVAELEKDRKELINALDDLLKIGDYTAIYHAESVRKKCKMLIANYRSNDDG